MTMERRAALTALMGASALWIAAGAAVAAETEFRFGGYIKLDVISTSYEDGQVPLDSTIRDFLVPALIPTGEEDSQTFDFHAKESRFRFSTVTRFEDGAPDLVSYLELDFMLSDLGDERVSNSYQPRMRHAWLEYGRWRFGQDWSTFMVVIFPEDLDFIGSSDGMIFERQPQVRYTLGPWQFAIENPDTTVTPNGGGERIDADSNTLPDVVGRYNWRGSWGEFSLAGLARQLAYVDNSLQIDETGFGWGLNAGGRFAVGKRDDVRVQVSFGEGLGRYAALNFTNAVVVDDSGGLEKIDTATAFVAYRHLWSERWRSTFNLSGIAVDNNAALTGLQANKSAWQWSANLIFSPRPPFSVGLEFMRAHRELEGGGKGALNRLQFSARYEFFFATKQGG
jgi:hypothetical protein